MLSNQCCTVTMLYCDNAVLWQCCTVCPCGRVPSGGGGSGPDPTLCGVELLRTLGRAGALHGLSFPPKDNPKQSDPQSPPKKNSHPLTKKKEKKKPCTNSL